MWKSGELSDGTDASTNCGSNPIIQSNTTTLTRQSSEILIVDGLETSQCTGYLFATLTYTSSTFTYTFESVYVSAFFYITETNQGLQRGESSTVSFLAGGIDLSGLGPLPITRRYRVEFQVESDEACDPNTDILLSAESVSNSDLVRFDAVTDFSQNCMGVVKAMLTQHDLTIEYSTPFVPVGTYPNIFLT